MYSLQQAPEKVAALILILIEAEIAIHLLGPAHTTAGKIPIPGANFPRLQGRLEIEFRGGGPIDAQFRRCIRGVQLYPASAARSRQLPR